MRSEWSVCRNGHPVVGANVFVNSSTGQRSCRTCRNAAARVYKKKTGRCGSCGRIWRGRTFKTCATCRKAIKDNYHKDVAGSREKARQRRTAARRQVLLHYGPICVCCKETTEEFLAIDHVEGGGNKHRRELGILAGSSFYLWLIKNNFPQSVQVLCHNCNMAKSMYGTCPHQRSK